MPGRRTHKVVGAAVGGGYALFRAKEQAPNSRVMETLGGIVGGCVGVPFADVLEPAISSWHRGLAHSFAAGAGVVSLRKTLESWEAACRHKADQCRAVPTQAVMYPTGVVFVPVPVDPVAQFLRELAELFWRFLAGFLNGFAAGYVSHLALDAATPRGIPLLGLGGAE